MPGGVDGKRYIAREAPARVMQKLERGVEAYRGEDVTDRAAADGTVARWGAGGRAAGG